MQNKTPFGSGPSSNRSVGSAGDGKSYARSSSADSAFSITSRRGQLYPNNARFKKYKDTPALDSSTTANGPPWLLAYVLLDHKSYQLNEHFQLSIRPLDDASGDQFHFQDIGNPRIHGEVYEHIRSEELATRDELEADIYLQETARLGGEWHKRLVETERLTKMLGLELDDLPGIAFRTSPFEGAAVLRFQEKWYATRAARWALIDTLTTWLRYGIDWTRLNPPPTTEALLERLPDKLAVLTVRIDEAVDTAVGVHAAVTADSEANVFRLRNDAWLISYDGHTEPYPDRRGFHYISYLLRHPNRDFRADSLRNMADGWDVQSDYHNPEIGSAPTGGVSTGSTKKGNKCTNRNIEDVIDETTKQKCRSQLRELREDYAEAEARSDWEQKEKIAIEIDQIEEYFRISLDRKGKSRHFSDDLEKARKSVTKAVNQALCLIKDSQPGLHDHLDKNLQRYTHLSYTPEIHVSWDVQLPQ